MRSLSFLALALVPLLHAKEWTTLQMGRLEPYHQQKGAIRQDISGGCQIGGRFYLVDDGGENADQTSVRAYRLSDLNLSPSLLPLRLPYRDLEAASCRGHILGVTTSMSMADEEQQGFRLFAEIEIDTNALASDAKPYLGIKEKSVDLRNSILDYLKNNGVNESWYKRAYSTFAKLGGLNLEGLSIDPQSKKGYFLGLRSPLWHTIYGNPAMDSNYSLTQGDAIVLHLEDPFQENLIYKHFLLDLEGAGIRSMEYIPALESFAIISGSPTSDQGNFKLWTWKIGQKPQEVQAKGFESMCRPETVAQIPCGSQQCLIVITEQSGKACKDPAAMTYMLIEIKK